MGTGFGDVRRYNAAYLTPCKRSIKASGRELEKSVGAAFSLTRWNACGYDVVNDRPAVQV